MKNIFIIIGKPKVGKSTFGDSLVKLLNITGYITGSSPSKRASCSDSITDSLAKSIASDLIDGEVWDKYATGVDQTLKIHQNPSVELVNLIRNALLLCVSDSKNKEILRPYYIARGDSMVYTDKLALFKRALDSGYNVIDGVRRQCELAAAVRYASSLPETNVYVVWVGRVGCKSPPDNTTVKQSDAKYVVDLETKDGEMEALKLLFNVKRDGGLL